MPRLAAEPDGRTMRERMLAGDPYIADDPELAEHNLRAMADGRVQRDLRP